MTLLEYLKQLHPVEWENFVKDTMILAEESAMFNGSVNPFANDEKGQTKADDLPLLVSRVLHQNLPFAHVYGLPFVRRPYIGLYLE